MEQIDIPTILAVQMWLLQILDGAETRISIQKISHFQQLGIPMSFADQMLLHQTLDGVECKISL